MKWEIGHWERMEGPGGKRGTEAEEEPGVVLVGAQSKGRRGAEADLYTAVNRENLSHRLHRLRQDQALLYHLQRWLWPRPQISRANLAPAFLNAASIQAGLFRLALAMSSAVLAPPFLKRASSRPPRLRTYVCGGQPFEGPSSAKSTENVRSLNLLWQRSPYNGCSP